VSFALTAKWIAREGEEERVREAIEHLIGPSLAEPGCLEYHANRSIDDPRVFLLYEVYESREAYEAHLETEHVRVYAKGLGIPLLEERIREFFETFAD
jgi:quinol monooxygenase YgiN